MKDILLGYEVGSGKEVLIPVRHMCVTGQTQESGKTTTLEALIGRSEKRAIAFVTKRGERSFESGRKILPYFQERADWEFVESVIEAIMRQKMKFERAWIVRACKGAESLADVRDNIRELMAKSKRSMDQDLYMLLGEYLDKVLPLLARLPKADEIQLKPGLNVMDLRSYPDELQMLIISSSMRWVHEEESDVITILPEAWKFAPQGRNTPVKLEVRKIAREGAGLKNYIWVDSQDIAGVEKEILRAASVWLIGVQRESNEIERSLSSIPKGIKRPKEGDIPQLRLGQFFACWGEHVRKVYVMPTWMRQIEAIKIARGEMRVEDITPPPRAKEEGMDYKSAYEEAQQTIGALNEQIKKLERTIASIEQTLVAPKASPAQIKEAQAHATTLEPLAASLVGEEVAMSLEVKRPVIDLTKRVYVVEANTDTLFGKIALLVSEGFFDQTKKAFAGLTELERRGHNPGQANFYREIAKLAELGFLSKEGKDGKGGYKTVPGMKVNVKEVEAVA
jgi:hypothetical protein